MMASENQRKKIKTMEVMVAESILETHDTTTLVLFTGNDHLDYLPGHFLTIDPHQFEALERWTAFLENEKGRKEQPRAYSMASAPDEQYLSITVKEEQYIPGITKYPPLLSPILAKRTSIGRKMVITGFIGPYTLPANDSPPNEILHICAGSGIVPNWSILKFTLRNFPTVKHRLIYSSRTLADTIYLDQLIRLRNQFPDQLDVVLALTRETPPEGNDELLFHRGRINRDVLSQTLSKMEDPVIYICGPANSKHDKKTAIERGTEIQPRFMETTLENLEELGVSKSRIKKESYG